MKSSQEERRESRIRLGVALNAYDPFIHRAAESLAEILRKTGAERAMVTRFDKHDPERAWPLIVIDAERSPARLGIPSEHFPGALALEFDPKRNLDKTSPQTLTTRLPSGAYFHCIEGHPELPAWGSAIVLELPAGAELTTEGEMMIREKAGEIHRETYVDAPTHEEGFLGFLGWPVVKDMEDFMDDEEELRRIERRFETFRHCWWFVGVFLGHGVESREHLKDRVRKRCAELPAGDPEAGPMAEILKAMEARALCLAFLRWADAVEREGHLNGARAIHGLAYRVAAMMQDAPLAIEAARYCGRTSRKLAEWEEAFRWYGVAQAVAEDAGDRVALGMTLDGVGNTLRDTGNLPKARETFLHMLTIGEEEQSAEVTARGHHGMMVLSNLAGDRRAAARHGLQAVSAYPDESNQVRALFDLGETLVEAGLFGFAEDAYWIVWGLASEPDHKVYSLLELAHIRALRGDPDGFENLCELASDEPGKVGGWVEAQMMLTRGEGSRVLGMAGEPERWFRKALVFAEERRLTQMIFKAEESLAGLAAVEEEKAPSPYIDEDSLADIGEGLREMRKTVEA